VTPVRLGGHFAILDLLDDLVDLLGGPVVHVVALVVLTVPAGIPIVDVDNHSVDLDRLVHLGRLDVLGGDVVVAVVVEVVVLPVVSAPPLAVVCRLPAVSFRHHVALVPHLVSPFPPPAGPASCSGRAV